MEGKGQSGHIDALLADPNTPDAERGKFQHLIKDGKHVVRDDVWIWYLGKTGNLTVGFGKAAEKNGVPFGPELGFGHVGAKQIVLAIRPWPQESRWEPGHCR